MDARDATIAQLRAEVANNRQTIALLRDQLNATQAALAAATGAQLAPAPPQLVVAAAKAYKLVHAEPDNVAHQIQVQRTGAIRRIATCRRPRTSASTSSSRTTAARRTTYNLGHDH